MSRGRETEGGMTVPEVLIAMTFIALAFLALLPMLSTGFGAISAGGAASKATAYASQLVEQIRNQAVTPATNLTCPNAPNPDNPEPGVVRTCTIAAVGATASPNRLWRVTVVVTVNQSAGTAGSPGITLETMRAE